MGINNAENGIDQALVGEVRQLRQDLNDLRTNPQKIGTGSIEFAAFGNIFDAIKWEGFAIAAGSWVDLYLDIDYTTYNGLPAIPAQSLFDAFIDVRIDADDEAHGFPYGVQTKTRISVWNSLAKSRPWGTADKIRRVYFQIGNETSATHTYYVRANFFWPRPPLKKI